MKNSDPEDNSHGAMGDMDRNQGTFGCPAGEAFECTRCDVYALYHGLCVQEWERPGLILGLSRHAKQQQLDTGMMPMEFFTMSPAI